MTDLQEPLIKSGVEEGGDLKNAVRGLGFPIVSPVSAYQEV